MSKNQSNQTKKKATRAQRNRRIIMAVLAVVMALLILLPTVSMIMTYAGAVTQSDIDNAKNNAKGLKDKRSELQNELKSLQNDKSKLMDQKMVLERQISVVQEQINNISEQITMYEALIAEKQVELEQAQQDEADQYQLFCERVRYMEEEGSVSLWSVLFKSSSFADLLDRYTLVTEIMEYDDQVMDQLVAIREQIARDKAELEQLKAEQEAAKQEQEAARQDLKDQEAEVDALAAKIAAEQAEIQGDLDDLESEAAALDKQIAKMEKELQEQMRAKGVVSEGSFAWPLPNYHNLSSLCGGRTDPFTGKPATHSGIDIPAAGGTPIKCAKSGIVSISAYNSGGYGEYVVVSHSDGTSTLYGHMTRGSRRVKEGDVVTQGQVLGLVGSTGRSTGNHLHFEIRVNGKRVDPVKYFSGLTYHGQPIS